jgi:hypothetical protein
MKSAHKKAQNATSLDMSCLRNIHTWIKAGESDLEILKKVRISQDKLDKLRKIYKHY